MLISNLHTPEGVKDYLPEECYLKKKVENTIIDVFTSYGYRTVSSPTFEYNDVFCGMGGVKDSRVFKFLDKTGSLLVLRPDMTPAIARIAATAYDKKDLPLKLCYKEPMFRTNENYQGKLREFTQAGIEFLGVNSIEADAEVVAVAIKALLSTGIKEFKVDIGHARFLSGVIEEASVDSATAKAIYNAIIKKNYVEVNELAENIANTNIKNILQELPLLIGGQNVIKKVEPLITNSESTIAINYLKELYSILDDMGYAQYVSFDLGVIGSMDYYTGLIFRGYAKGTGASVLDGGRYDNMVEKFGTSMPAVGFAIKVNELLKTIENTKEYNNGYIVVYSNENRTKAFKLADSLREKGASAELSFCGTDISTNKEYALNKGIRYIIVVDDMTLIDITDNTSSTVALESLSAKEAK